MKTKLFILLGLTTSALASLRAATFTVTNLNDSGAGSLRQAIADANANPGTDEIAFSIPGAGPYSIKVLSALPIISDPVTIDATTQPGFAGKPIIELNGTNATGPPGLFIHGFEIHGGGTTVKGFVINSFTNGNGIELDFGGGNQIQGNYIGTDITGTKARPNFAAGIRSASPNNVIGGTTPSERNVISANGYAGIQLITTTSNFVQGNYIGTDVTGTRRLGNAISGVAIFFGGGNHVIGGTAPGSGNLLSGNGTQGINIERGSSDASVVQGVLVQGNLIGTDVTGTTNLGNIAGGIRVSNAVNNVIGGTNEGARNIVSGNKADGIIVINATGNRIQGNFIGTDSAGLKAIPNIGNGVIIDQGASNNVVGGLTISSRNLISGNGGSGVTIQLSSANSVQGNFLGTDLSGNSPLPNAGAGVFAGGSRNSIGSGTVAGRNLISGNAGHGVYISGATDNSVQGNFIGTDVNGTSPLGNTGDGVEIEDAFNTTVGGTTSGPRNIVSGNKGNGVVITGFGGAGNLVRGNFIGTAASGTAALSNGLAGVLVASGQNHTIGGANAGGGNVIAFNRSAGVLIVEPVTGTLVQRNSIFSNTGLGIDLEGDGVTANDAQDADDGANGLQNFPELSSAVTNSGGTTIQGTMNSAPSTAFTLEFFSNPACDTSGFGQGQVYIGTTNVTTDGSGLASINVTFTNLVPVGQVIAATATDPANNTSEFSPCVLVSAPPAFADLAITLSATPNPVAIGNQATITVSVTNGGPSLATAVGLTNQFAAGLSIVSANSGAGSCVVAGNIVSCSLGDLTNGASATVAIVLNATSAGSMTNTSLVASGAADPNLANNGANLVIHVQTAAPVVSIINPTNGAAFIFPSNIVITANASEANGVIAQVDFIAGTNLLGTATNPPFTLLWTNPPVGSNVLTARAVDTQGVATISAPVSVTVNVFGGPPAFRFDTSAYQVGEGDGTVTLRVVRNFSGFATVNYTTGPGSATEGSDYSAAAGQLQFQTGDLAKTLSVTIKEDTVVEGNETFTVALSLPSTGGLSDPSVATVTIVDDDVQTGSSYLSILPPPPVDENSLGSLRVYLTNEAGLGQWRLPWERTWRASGTAATGLLPGQYDIQFKPVSGYLVPPLTTLLVRSALETRSTNGYAQLVSTPPGSLTVFIDPREVANNPDGSCRGQWQRSGEGVWHNSGETVTGLPADNYLIHFSTLQNNCGWGTPADRYASVLPGASNALHAAYYWNVPGPSTPVALDFDNDINNSYNTGLPYAVNGQLVTDYGEASGFVVKERIVLTAAHVVFDDYSLTYVANVRWLFQRHPPNYNPAPQTVRGYYVNGGYAAQRQAENTPGVSATASFDLDVAALYFYEPAGRGGYGGYLVSQSPAPEWLQTNAQKVLVGYPVEGILDVNRGKMHAIRPQTMSFGQVSNAVFSSAQARSFPGNSGGPLCVLLGNGFYYPAGVYVGGADNAIVRAIDSRAVDLINAAELTANIGTNNVGGGVIRITPFLAGGGFCNGYLTVALVPPPALVVGAAWRIAPRYTAYGTLTSWTNGTAARVPLQNGPFEIEFRGAAGFLSPVPPDLSIPCDLQSNLVFNYVQLLPRLDIVQGNNLVLSGVTSSTYRVEYSPTLRTTNPWSLLTNISFPANNGTAVISNALPGGPSNRFLRAVRPTQ